MNLVLIIRRFSWLRRPLFCLLAALAAGPSLAQTALPINVQGRVTTNGVAFTGLGRFKFALVQGNGQALLWSHDGTGALPSFQPSSSLQLNVANGLYSAALGDTSIPGMTQPIAGGIFENPDVRLRIWFNDGSHGFQQLSPDQRMGAVGFALNSQRSDTAAILTGSVSIDQVPATLITNNATAVNLTGSFTGDGSGLVGLRGSTPFQVAGPGVNNAVPNTGYLVTGAAETTILLPATAGLRVGDIVRVSGPNPGSWKVAQRDGQSIRSAAFSEGIGSRWIGRDSSRAWTGIATSEDGLRLAAVTYSAGFIYLSTNAGVTWTSPQVSPKANWRSIASSADGSRLLAAPEGGNLSMSTDFGETWSARAIAGSRNWWSAASSANGTNLVAVAFAGPIYTSADGGNTWTAPPTAGTRNWVSVAASRDGTNIIAAVSGERLYVSKDRGASWFGVNAGSRGWTSVASSADGSRLVAGVNLGFIYTSADGGANWVQRDGSGSRAWVSVTSSADGNKLAGVATSGALYTSMDAGATWTPRTGALGWYAVTSTPDGRKIAGTVFNGLIHTSEASTVPSTTVGTAGYLVGDQYSAVELQHLGNGQFFPISSAGTIFAY